MPPLADGAVPDVAGEHLGMKGMARTHSGGMSQVDRTIVDGVKL